MTPKSSHHPLSNFLPGDRVLRRVHAHSAVTEGGRFDVHLLNIANSEACWDNDQNYVQQVTQEAVLTVRVGVGALPALSLNQVFRGKWLKPAVSLLPQQRFRLDIESGCVQLLGSVGLAREQYWREHPSAFDDSHVAVYRGFDACGATVKVIIPCVEIVRLFYTPSSQFANALLRGAAYDDVISQLICLKNTRLDEDILRVRLREYMRSDRITAQCAGLLAMDPSGRKFARIFLRSNGPGAFFNALIPTSRPSLAVVGEALGVRGTAIPTYFLLRLVKTENPLPRSIRYVAYGQCALGEGASRSGSLIDESGLHRPFLDPDPLTTLTKSIEEQRYCSGRWSDLFPVRGREAAWENSIKTYWYGFRRCDDLRTAG